MSQSRRGQIIAILLLLAPGAAVGAQSFAWWKSEQFQKEVGLTTEQCARIDNIFQAAMPKLRESKEELDKQEAKLSNLIAESADEAATSNTASTREAVTLACCPPGPEERDVRVTTSESGMSTPCPTHTLPAASLLSAFSTSSSQKTARR